jgi:HlyD family secretion protein
MVKWISFFLAALGLGVAAYTVATAVEPPKDLPPARSPSVNPFGRGFAALGFVETATREVQIAAPESGLVLEVFAEVNDRVRRGDPLLRLDARAQEAAVLRAEAGLRTGERELLRLRAQPRAEDLPPLQADVSRTAALVAEREEELARLQTAQGQSAATEWEARRLKILADQARAAAAGAQADLDRLKAGAWSQDVIVSEARVAQLKADLDASKLLLERMTVRAPRDGTILRREVEPGEYADPNGELLILGDLSALNIRAQVDEDDLPLLTRRPVDKAVPLAAVARTRGALPIKLDLELVRVEPLARRKSDLSGANAERIDTRVIDVVFRVKASEKQGLGLVPGQAVDVFIDAPEPSEGQGAGSGRQ